MVTLEQYPFYIRQATTYYPELADRYVVIDYVKFLHVPQTTSSYVAVFKMVYWDNELSQWKRVVSTYAHDGEWFMETFPGPFEDTTKLFRQLHLFVMSKVLFNQQPRPIQTVMGLIKEASRKGRQIQRSVMSHTWLETWDYQHVVEVRNAPHQDLTVDAILSVKARLSDHRRMPSLELPESRGKVLKVHCPMKAERHMDYEMLFLELCNNEPLWDRSLYVVDSPLDVTDVPFPQ